MSLPWPACLLRFVKAAFLACYHILGYYEGSAHTKSIYRVGRSGWHAGATCAMGPWDTDDWSPRHRVAPAAGLFDLTGASNMTPGFKDSSLEFFTFG